MGIMTRARVRDRAVSSTLQRKQAELRDSCPCKNHVCLPDPSLARTMRQAAHCWLVICCYHVHKCAMVFASFALMIVSLFLLFSVLLCEAGVADSPVFCEAMPASSAFVLPTLALVSGYGGAYSLAEWHCTVNLHHERKQQ